MSAGMLQPGSKLLASGAVSAAGTSNSTAFTLPWVDAWRFILIANTLTGTTPTFDGVLQDSPDGGITWVNLPLRFSQITTAGGQSYIIAKPIGFADAASAGVVAATGGALAANTPVNVQNVRLFITAGGTAPAFTYTLYVNSVQRGNTGSAS